MGWLGWGGRENLGASPFFTPFLPSPPLPPQAQTVGDVFARQLLQLGGVGGGRVVAVLRRFPTPARYWGTMTGGDAGDPPPLGVVSPWGGDWALPAPEKGDFAPPFKLTLGEMGAPLHCGGGGVPDTWVPALTPPCPPRSLMAAYSSCSHPQERETLLSTIKCGPLQR